MNTQMPDEWPQFYTATIEGWDHLLKGEKYKLIILNSLKFLTENNRVKINAFVIMSNHIHLIWQGTGGHSLKEVQTAFKKYTSQHFIKMLKEENNLQKYEVKKADRKHHFWKRNSLGIDLFTPSVLVQKLYYIHYNPVRAGLCELPEEYNYSSAAFYEGRADKFGILEDYRG